MTARNETPFGQPVGRRPVGSTREKLTADQPQSGQALLISGPAYALRAELLRTPYGRHLRFVSFVASARRPEDQVKFQGLFSADQLRALRNLIDREIAT